MKNGSLILDEQKAYQIGVYMHKCSVKLRFKIWVALQYNLDNLRMIHPFIIDLMIATANERIASNMAPVTIEEAREKREQKKKRTWKIPSSL